MFRKVLSFGSVLIGMLICFSSYFGYLSKRALGSEFSAIQITQLASESFVTILFGLVLVLFGLGVWVATILGKMCDGVACQVEALAIAAEEKSAP